MAFCEGDQQVDVPVDSNRKIAVLSVGLYEFEKSRWKPIRNLMKTYLDQNLRYECASAKDPRKGGSEIEVMNLVPDFLLLFISFTGCMN